MDRTVRGWWRWLALAVVVGALFPAVASAVAFREPDAASPKAKPVRVSLNRPASVAAGGLATFTGASARATQIALQRHTTSGWRSVASGRSGETGRFSLTWIAPSKAGTFIVRAVVLVTGRTKAISKSQRLVVRRVHGTVITVSSRTTVISHTTVVSAPTPGQAGALTYSGGNSVQPGAIVAIAPGAADPDGFLGRVTSVQTNGSNTIAQTMPATLEQAIPNGSFNQQMSNFTVNTHRLDSALRQAATATAQCQAGVSASVDAHASMGLSVNLAGTWSLLHGLQTATFTGNANANASITATVNGSGSCTLNPYHLVSINGPSDLFWIGPVPVYLSSKITIDVKGSTSIKANATAGLSGGLDAEAGLKWDHGSISPVHQFTHTLKASAPTASASGDVTATLLPTIQLSVDGGGHADLNLSAGLDFHADTTANPWWTITAPVAITGDLNISKLHVSTPTIDIWSQTFTLARASGGFGSGGGGGGGGGGTNPTTDALSIGNPGTQTTAVGGNANLVLSAVSSSGATIAYSTSKLPPGLSLNTSTGTITGSPTTAGSYSVTVSVSDTTGASASTTFTWTVNATGVTATSGAAISAGESDTCAIDQGAVDCWGANTDGDIGADPSVGPQSCGDQAPCSLTPIQAGSFSDAIGVAAGGQMTCAALGTGAVDCWGTNSDGNLGDGSDTGPNCSGGCSAAPVPVSGISTATGVSAGAYHSCAVLSGGGVDCWGYNGTGELGDGTTTGPDNCSNACGEEATPVTGITTATDVAAGGYHSCALLSSGGVECWGDNSNGDLGNASTTNSDTPVPVTGISNAIQISTGVTSSCALLSTGAVDCWGDNGAGELGNGSDTGPDTCTPYYVACSTTPIQVPGITNATQISVGDYYACARLADSTVECWGEDQAGQLGTSTPPSTCSAYSLPCSTSPVAVAGLTNAAAVATAGTDYSAAPSDHTCATLSTGGIDCWGDNTYGELGDDSQTSSPTPVAVSSFP